MTQLGLDLPHTPALGRADFLVSDCNAVALGWIERWPEWPSNTLVLHGPSGCGKSHLARLWSQRSAARLIGAEALAGFPPDGLARSGAVAVDDAERAPERELLHLYNCCREAGASLLIVARNAPSAWELALPDLASRLCAAPNVAIGRPDDALLGAVLVKHFADRQLRVPPRVIAFLLRRMERSFAAAALVAEELDRLALGAKRPVSLTLARQVLAE